MKSPTILKNSFSTVPDHICHYHPHPLRENVEYCRVCKNVRFVEDRKRKNAFRLLLALISVGLITLAGSLALQPKVREEIVPLKNFLNIVTHTQ
jgi:hypothetical protein